MDEFDERPSSVPFPGFRPDVVVLGTGLVGCALVDELMGLDPRLKVLALEAGPSRLEDHGQRDLGGRALYEDSSVARWELAGGLPPSGLVEMLGGSSVAWSGWCPRPTRSEWARWPQEVAHELQEVYLARAERALRVGSVAHDGPTVADLRDRVCDAVRGGLLPGCDEPQAAPLSLADDGRAYSPLTRLRERVRREPGRLRVLPSTRVTRLDATAGAVTAICTPSGNLEIDPATPVVLAMGTIESAWHVAMLGGNTAGREVNGHVLSEVTVRIPTPRRRAPFEWGAFLVPGRSDAGHFNLQVHVGHGATSSDPATFLRSRVPGLYGDEILAGVSESHLVVNLAALGEMDAGDGSSVEVRRGASRPAVTMPDYSSQRRVLEAMDDAIDRFLDLVETEETEFRGPGPHVQRWQRARPGRTSMDDGGRHWRRVVHQSGSLAMSADPSGAVDTDCAVRGFANLWACGLGVFPAAGAHNGALTATAIALRLADRLAAGAR